VVVGDSPISSLLLDVGGILGTNGWDTAARDRAAARFAIDRAEMEGRHRAAFDAFEVGSITLRQYLDLCVFWRPRDFAVEDFEAFMFEQSQPHQDAIEFFAGLKERNSLRVVAVSNEGRELADYRIGLFGLSSLADAFVVSGYVGMRKPNPGIYQLALAVCGSVPRHQALVIDDRPLLVEMASSLGLRVLHYMDLASTKRDLAEIGLT
jgi:putative hydrolase of the HAD superfamily